MCSDCQIVSEPPPLWEIPPDCDPLTCDVIQMGLVKEPREKTFGIKTAAKDCESTQNRCKLFLDGYKM